MVSIHHTYFPHIIDTIFDCAEPGSLAVMARTCRAWRRRCLSRFYVVRCRHGSGSLADLPVVIWDQYDRELHFSENSELALLAGCHILDIVGHTKPDPNRFFPNLKTTRYHSTKAVDTGVTAEAPALPVDQIVCQAEVLPFDSRCPTVKQLVIHCAAKYMSSWNGHDEPGDADFTGLPNLERLVVIFETVPIDMVEFHEGYDETDNPESVYFDPERSDNQCTIIRRIVAAAHAQNAVVVLVGTEGFAADAFSAIRLGVERAFDSHESAMKSTRPITLVTLDAYRHGVGEKEWAIQTCWDKPLTP